MQQSFLRIKMAFSIRRKNPPMEVELPVAVDWLMGGVLLMLVILVDMSGYVVDDGPHGG